MRRRINITAIIAITVLLLVVLLMDIYKVFGQLQQQAKDAGVSQLETISRELEKTIGDAQSLTMEIAIESGELLSDKDALEKYIYEKKEEIVESKTGAFNVYIAGDNWSIIPDFDAPQDYVARERPWYKGAIRKGLPGNHRLSGRHHRAIS